MVFSLVQCFPTYHFFLTTSVLLLDAALYFSSCKVNKHVLNLLFWREWMSTYSSSFKGPLDRWRSFSLLDAFEWLNTRFNFLYFILLPFHFWLPAHKVCASVIYNDSWAKWVIYYFLEISLDKACKKIQIRYSKSDFLSLMKRHFILFPGVSNLWIFV